MGTNCQLTTAEGDLYAGKFENDTFTKGKATISYPGAKYEGDWSKGQKHGEGVLTYTDGRTVKGTWRYNKQVGKAIITDPSTGESLFARFDDYGKLVELKDQNDNIVHSEMEKDVKTPGTVEEHEMAIKESAATCNIF